MPEFSKITVSIYTYRETFKGFWSYVVRLERSHKYLMTFGNIAEDALDVKRNEKGRLKLLGMCAEITFF